MNLTRGLLDPNNTPVKSKGSWIISHRLDCGCCILTFANSIFTSLHNFYPVFVQSCNEKEATNKKGVLSIKEFTTLVEQEYTECWRT